MAMLAAGGESSLAPRDAARDAGGVQALFDTTLAPRLDPLFPDAAGVRTLIERFENLNAEMQKIRDDFSTAVQRTLATLPGAMPSAPIHKREGSGAAGCPERALASYARAAAAGARFLELGRALEGLHRQIRRAEDQGETLALTPDYRNQARLSHDAYRALLTDYREMHVAFYEQLGAELHHVGCDRRALAVPSAAVAVPGLPALDPADAAAWALEDPAAVADVPLKPEERPRPPTSASAPAVWITVDNGGCLAEARVVLDGGAPAFVSGGKQLTLRTTAGPHELCALPATDHRACGTPGTIRHAYFHEGWTFTLSCPRPRDDQGH